MAIEAPGALGADASRVLDARERYVLPGVIDGHVHFRELLEAVVIAVRRALGDFGV